MKKKEIKRRLKQSERHIAWLESQTHNLFAMYREHKEDIGKINSAMERLGGRVGLVYPVPVDPVVPEHERLRRAGVPISVSRSSVPWSSQSESPPLPTGFEPGWSRTHEDSSTLREDCCDKNGDLYFVGPEPEGAEHGE